MLKQAQAIIVLTFGALCSQQAIAGCDVKAIARMSDSELLHSIMTHSDFVGLVKISDDGTSQPYQQKLTVEKIFKGKGSILKLSPWRTVHSINGGSTGFRFEKPKGEIFTVVLQYNKGGYFVIPECPQMELIELERRQTSMLER